MCSGGTLFRRSFGQLRPGSGAFTRPMSIAFPRHGRIRTSVYVNLQWYQCTPFSQSWPDQGRNVHSRQGEEESSSRERKTVEVTP